MIEAKTYDINVVNDIQRILDKYKVDFNYLEYLKGYLDSNIKNKCCDTTIEFLQIKAIKGIDIKFYNDDTITYSRSPIELHDGNIYIVNLPISLDDAFENKAENYIRNDCCILCKNKVTSFCNSHLIPQFVLNNICDCGKLAVGQQIIENEANFQ